MSSDTKPSEQELRQAWAREQQRKKNLKLAQQRYVDKLAERGKKRVTLVVNSAFHAQMRKQGMVPVVVYTTPKHAEELMDPSVSGVIFEQCNGQWITQVSM